MQNMTSGEGSCWRSPARRQTTGYDDSWRSWTTKVRERNINHFQHPCQKTRRSHSRLVQAQRYSRQHSDSLNQRPGASRSQTSRNNVQHDAALGLVSYQPPQFAPHGTLVEAYGSTTTTTTSRHSWQADLSWENRRRVSFDVPILSYLRK